MGRYRLIVAQSTIEDAVAVRRALEFETIAAYTVYFLNGDEVVDYFSHRWEGGPGLLIMDTALPRRNALQIIEWLKSHASTREIRTILIGTVGQGPAWELANKSSAEGYFLRPPTAEAFDTLIREIVLAGFEPKFAHPKNLIINKSGQT